MMKYASALNWICENFTPQHVWPLAEAFLRRDEAWVRAFMTSPPQTNETGRACGQIQATARADCLLVLILRAALAALLHLPQDYSVFGRMSRGSEAFLRSGRPAPKGQGFVRIRRFALWG